MQASSIEEQLVLLRNQTQMWGTIDPDQTLQLKLWGLLFTPGSQRVEVTVDIDGWTVRYQVEGPADMVPDEDKLAELGNAVRWLLGDGWNLELRVPMARWGYREDGDETCRTIKRQRTEDSKSLTPAPKP